MFYPKNSAAKCKKKTVASALYYNPRYSVLAAMYVVDIVVVCGYEPAESYFKIHI